MAGISPWDANQPDYAKCGASILYKDPPQVIEFKCSLHILMNNIIVFISSVTRDFFPKYA